VASPIFKKLRLAHNSEKGKMKQTTPLIKRSSFWSLALGVAIGGASMASLRGIPFVSTAHADGSTNPRLAATMSASNMATLKALDDSYAALADAVEPAVVNIQVSAAAKPGAMSMMGGGAVEGAGSGVIIRPDGYIITNDHVVAGMDKVTVSLTDGRKFPGKVIRGDGSDDIAVVKIEATGLPTLPFADSDKIRAGQISMAVGSPFDLQNSVTIGHISAVGRQQALQDTHANQVREYPDLVQTDAAINPGNSGGALVNIDGEVVGINTMIASQSGSSSGVSFAIPSNEARLVAELLIQHGSAKRALIGIRPGILTQIQQQQLGVTQGAYVTAKVDPSTPAGKAGIQQGDVVVRIGSTPIVTYMDVRDTMYKYKAGDTVTVEIVRDGKHKDLSVTLMAAPPPEKLYQQQRMSPQGEDPFGDGQNPFHFEFPNQRNNGNGGTQHQGGSHLGAGIAPLSDEIRAQFSIPKSANGVVVESVEPGSLAESLGMEPGDVITKFDGDAVTTPDALVKKIRSSASGAQGSIEFDRWTQGGHTTISKSFSFN
jgi:serine protease Do